MCVVEFDVGWYCVVFEFEVGVVWWGFVVIGVMVVVMLGVVWFWCGEGSVV